MSISLTDNPPPTVPADIPLLALDPAQIKTDAQTYQFRSGGDARGVTEQSRIVGDHWDAVLHGDPILVHERLGGTLFVADGHHRLDFAQRLNAEGHGPGAIYARVLREADGYTPEDVRVIAAYKNMATGHATPVEGARVFQEAFSGRVNTDLLPQLQMDKSNLRLMVTLSGLNNLDRVESGEIPVDMAADLARRTPDPVRQEAVMNIISKKLHQNGYGGVQGEYSSDMKPAVFARGDALPAWLPGFSAQIARQRSGWVQGLSRS